MWSRKETARSSRISGPVLPTDGVMCDVWCADVRCEALTRKEENLAWECGSTRSEGVLTVAVQTALPVADDACCALT
eukprot:1612293-Rhodomonas_salina.6